MKIKKENSATLNMIKVSYHKYDKVICQNSNNNQALNENAH